MDKEQAGQKGRLPHGPHVCNLRSMYCFEGYVRGLTLKRNKFHI